MTLLLEGAEENFGNDVGKEIDVTKNVTKDRGGCQNR